MAESARTIRISEKLILAHFVADESALTNIEQFARSAAAGSGDPDNVTTEYSVVTNANRELEFSSFRFLIDYLKDKPQDVEFLAMAYTVKKESGVRVHFDQDGVVTLKGFSDATDFDFELDRLRQVLLQLKQKTNWFVRSFDSLFVRKILAFLLLPVSIGLLTCLGYYAYARAVGVDVDPKLIPSGNQPYQQIADAIRSNDTNKKLDALLTLQLKDFTNVRDVFTSVGRLIRIHTCFIVMLVAMLGLRRLLASLYPKAFFLFGPNEKLFQGLQTKRQVWGIAIGVAFVVNLIAGFVVAVIMK